jgi:hypothetical protein
MALINDGRPFRSRDAAEHFSSSAEFKDSLRTGTIRWVARRVAVDSNIPDSRSLRAQAARLVMPEYAIACDDYAAFILGASTEPPGRRWEQRPTYLVTHASYVSRPGYAIVRQSTDIPDADIMEIEGLRITAPVRTASDVLRRHFRPYALAAGDAMYRARLITPGTVGDYLGDLFHLPGLRQARELVTRLTPDAESHGESWLRCRILDAGFPRPSIQFKIPDSRGVIRRFDMAYEQFRVAPEYDGREDHTAVGDQEFDEDRRDDFRRRLGWRFPIGTYERVFGQNPAYDLELGAMIGRDPLPRRWW